MTAPRYSAPETSLRLYAEWNGHWSTYAWAVREIDRLRESLIEAEHALNRAGAYAHADDCAKTRQARQA